jgi:hypothetical protein
VGNKTESLRVSSGSVTLFLSLLEQFINWLYENLHYNNLCRLFLSLIMSCSITDTAFSYLKGIHSLDISHCNQSTITDHAFSYLQGSYTINPWFKSTHYYQQSILLPARYIYISVLKLAPTIFVLAVTSV